MADCRDPGKRWIEHMALALMALPPDLDPKVGTPEMALAGGLGVVRHSGGLDMRSQGRVHAPLRPCYRHTFRLLSKGLEGTWPV